MLSAVGIRLLFLQCLPRLIPQLIFACVAAPVYPLQTLQDEQAGRGLLIPLLRSLGNLAAGGGSAAVDQLLSPDAAPALQALVTCAQVRVLTVLAVQVQPWLPQSPAAAAPA